MEIKLAYLKLNCLMEGV